VPKLRRTGSYLSALLNHCSCDNSLLKSRAALRKQILASKVSTVDSFQGSECDVVLISFVRCNKVILLLLLLKQQRMVIYSNKYGRANLTTI
jgi:hypothetical protein